MPKIIAPRVESSGENEPRQQVVRIDSGLYGGMFSWYSMPKMYAKYQSTEVEEKFYVGFVVTHDRAYRELPNYSECMTGIRTKRFYDETTGMKTAYVSLLFALFGGKKSYAEIEGMSDDELPDFNDLIGRPVTLFVEANTKPDKSGLFGHKAKGIEPADKELIAAIKPLYAAKKVTENDKGIARLVLPCAAFADDVLPASVTDDEVDMDEIPF